MPDRRRLAFHALTLAVTLLWIGAPGCSRHEAKKEAAVPAAGAAKSGRTYAQELAQLEATIAGLNARIQQQENAPSAYEQAAGAHLQRARLTGDYADYAAAESLITRAFAISPPGAGPFLTRAHLNFTLHRLAPIEADLKAEERSVMVDDATRADITALRANIDFHSGRYPEARRGFEAAHQLHRSIGSLLNLATYDWQTGDFAAAESLLDSAEAMYHGEYAEPRAWVHLQRGLMDLDRGRWDEALAHYHRADSVLSGWWLVQEHIAEVTTLEGHSDQALAMYEYIVARTGNPEFMDAIAKIQLAKGDSAAAQPWIDRAEKIYTDRLARFPEASAGHALDHFLEFEPDAGRLIRLAEENYRLRPGGQAG
ncbi:MAG TPA: hypothetical protein VNM87_02965, partial [Candidatus Udaeobacter sp.]|nr:hypothetical protein [Candidatus Udaeobacter sp.]